MAPEAAIVCRFNREPAGQFALERQIEGFRVRSLHLAVEAGADERVEVGRGIGKGFSGIASAVAKRKRGAASETRCCFCLIDRGGIGDGTADAELTVLREVVNEGFAEVVIVDAGARPEGSFWVGRISDC